MFDYFGCSVIFFVWFWIFDFWFYLGFDCYALFNWIYWVKMIDNFVSLFLVFVDILLIELGDLLCDFEVLDLFVLWIDSFWLVSVVFFWLNWVKVLNSLISCSIFVDRFNWISSCYRLILINDLMIRYCPTYSFSCFKFIYCELVHLVWMFVIVFELLIVLFFWVRLYKRVQWVIKSVRWFSECDCVWVEHVLVVLSMF